MKINNECARKILFEVEKIPYGETLTVAKLEQKFKIIFEFLSSHLRVSASKLSLPTCSTDLNSDSRYRTCIF